MCIHTAQPICSQYAHIFCTTLNTKLPITATLVKYSTLPTTLFNLYKDWFYNTAKFETPRDVVVESEGFVFVTVVDDVEITRVNGTRVAVTRAWGDAEDFVCDVDAPSPNSMPILGNYHNHSNHHGWSKFHGSSKSSKSKLAYGLRSVANVGEYAQDPSTHLLVNLWTSVKVDDTSDQAFIEKAATMCSGLRYQFSEQHQDFATKGSKQHQDFATKGSYVLSNEMSSFEMRDYTWKGGQLITNGPKVDLRSVNMKHGLYLPDESCFCSKLPSGDGGSAGSLPPTKSPNVPTGLFQ